MFLYQHTIVNLIYYANKINIILYNNILRNYYTYYVWVIVYNLYS